MGNNESRPAWLTDLCENKAPGIIFRNRLSLPDMERINAAVKRAGRTVIVTGELTDAQGKRYETASYCELAKTVLMSQGVFGQEVRTAVWMDYIGMYVARITND